MLLMKTFRRRKTFKIKKNTKRSFKVKTGSQKVIKKHLHVPVVSSL